MDLNDIKSIVLNEISGKSGIDSLKLQNHIYGCFLIMEDIAQKKFEIFYNNIISTKTFTLDLDKQFSEFGLRYGFILDTKLLLDNYTKEYKNIWLKYFNDIDIAHNIDDVDKIEDSLIDIIQKNIKPDEAYFINALESGSLSQEWIDRILKLLSPPSENQDETNTINTAISKAQTEKPTKRRLSTTRRNKKTESIPNKKSLAKTRRNR
jgi:hypothetical protein